MIVLSYSPMTGIKFAKGWDADYGPPWWDILFTDTVDEGEQPDVRGPGQDEDGDKEEEEDL